MNNYKKVLYLDIETATKYENIEALKSNDKKGFELLKMKYSKSEREITLEEYYLTKCTVLPAFSKIVCLCLGYYVDDNLVIKSFDGKEKDILTESLTVFDNAGKGLYSVCGYYLKKFDIPWIVLKMLKYKIKVPKVLTFFDKKPWEVPVFDLYDELNARYWSLAEVSYELGVDVPQFGGSEVNEMYYGGNQSDIVIHCESDVKSTTEIYKVIYENLN
jgi:3'-5' exonuclease